MKRPADFVDSFGILDKHNGPDGGDSAHREGMFWTLIGFLKMNNFGYWLTSAGRNLDDFQTVMNKIHPHPGVIVRHPNPDWDASDWDRMSRDQIIPCIMAMGLWGRHELKKFAWGHLKRGFLFTNNVRQNGATKRNHGQGNYSYAWRFPDVTLFEVWAIFIRAFKAWPLWPLLVIFDLETLGGAIIWRWFPKHNIAMNHCLVILFGKARLPTPTMWLARKIMPPERLIKLIGEHFRDFRQGDQVMDMEFFEPMLTHAWNDLRTKS
jgi:hypothetical protein